MALLSFNIIISVIIVSLISFVGVLTFLFNEKKLNKFLFLFVSLSAGTMFGGAFLHLLPEAVERAGSFTTTISLMVLSSIVVFFLLNKLIHLHHSHEESSLVHVTTKNKESIAYLNLIGDGIHNFLDGLVIAGSYLVAIPIGIATTIAVIVHEIPQELTDFGVLIYSGFSKWKAVFFNLLSAATAVIGALIGIYLGTRSQNFITFVLPFAAGSFIYIAGSNLIPEILSGKHKFKQFMLQLAMFLIGIIIMYLLLFLG